MEFLRNQLFNAKFFKLSLVCLTLLIGVTSVPISANAIGCTTNCNYGVNNDRASIIMTDTILRVVYHNPKEAIQQVDVKDINGQSVIQFAGCNKHNCRYDIANLSAGYYVVTVTLSKGKTFSKVVQKK